MLEKLSSQKDFQSSSNLEPGDEIMNDSDNYLLAAKQPDIFRLMGVLPLNNVDVSSVHRFMERVITHGEKALVLNLNVHAATLALELDWFRNFLNQGQMVFCDGDGIRLACKILKMPVPVKITYDRWMWELASFCEQKGYSLYFLGSKPGVSDRAAKKLQEHYPKLKFAGCYHGYFEKSGSENEKIIREINAVKPDILIVGFGMPLQEKWLQENWKRLNVHIFLNGGAAFECVSGELKSPPRWILQL